MASLSLPLADDHTMVRQVLERVSEACPEWDVIAEPGNGRDAAREAEEHHPDVAILDIAMPMLNGIDAADHDTLPGHEGADAEHAC